MSKQLDTIIDNYIKVKDIQLENTEDERREILEAAKQELKRKIYKEIKEEVKDEACREAARDIENMAELRRINDFRKLAVDGLVVAFFVGLLVNQCTDLIGYFKGSVTLDNVYHTIILCIVFLVVCILVFGSVFVSSLIRMLKEKKNASN